VPWGGAGGVCGSGGSTWARSSGLVVRFVWRAPVGAVFEAPIFFNESKDSLFPNRKYILLMKLSFPRWYIMGSALVFAKVTRKAFPFPSFQYVVILEEGIGPKMEYFKTPSPELSGGGVGAGG
jgi:hypothetical protein